MIDMQEAALDYARGYADKSRIFFIVERDYNPIVCGCLVAINDIYFYKNKKK